MKKRRVVLLLVTVLIILVGAIVYFVFRDTNSNGITVDDAQEMLGEKIAEVLEQFGSDDAYEIAAIKRAADIKVEKIEKTDDGISTTCTVTSLDVGKRLTDLLYGMMNKEVAAEEYNAKLKEAVDSAESVTATYTLSFSKDENGEYVVDDIPYDVYDGILGGYLTFAQKAIEAVEGYLND